MNDLYFTAKNKKGTTARAVPLLLVQVTGFPPVAALADKQSTGLFGPSDKLLRIFLPISNPSTLINKKGTTARAVPLFVGAGDGI